MALFRYGLCKTGGRSGIKLILSLFPLLCGVLFCLVFIKHYAHSLASAFWGMSYEQCWKQALVIYSTG